MPHLRRIFNLTKALINERPRIILRSYGGVSDLDEIFMKAKHALEQVLSWLDDVGRDFYEKMVRWYERCTGRLRKKELAIEGFLDDCLPFVHDVSAMSKYQVGVASLVAISLLLILWSIVRGRQIVFSHCVLIDKSGRQSHSWSVSNRKGIQVTMREVYNLLRRPQIKAVVLSRRYGGIKKAKEI